MARDLFLNLTNGTFVKSATDPTVLSADRVFRGDSKTINLYFLEEANDFQAPLTFVDKTASTVKFGIGQLNGEPEAGTWTLTYGANTTSALDFDATATEIETALNLLASIVSAGGVTVSGSIATRLQIRFDDVGSRTAFSANVEGLTPDSTATISERVAGDVDTAEVVEIHLETQPAIYQPTWSDLSTTVTATPSTVTGGSSTANEVQKIVLSQQPVSGNVSVTMPADTRSVTGMVAGVATCSANHGFVVGQPIAFSASSGSSNYTDGTTYYVAAIPSRTTFTFAATNGGAALTTAAATSATANTIAETTTQLEYNFTPSELQVALEALDCVGDDNVDVSGVTGESYVIAFKGDKGLANLQQVTVTLSSVTAAPGKTATVNYSTYAARDLLGDETSVDLTCEVRLDDDTVLQSTVTLSERLILSGAMGPAVLNGSYRYGKVDITSGATSQAVTFAPAMTAAPTSVRITIGIPTSASAIIYGVVDLSTLATTGFTAILSAAAPNGNYDLYYDAQI